MTNDERYARMDVRRRGPAGYACAAGPHASDTCHVAHRSYETAERCPEGRRQARRVARRHDARPEPTT